MSRRPKTIAPDWFEQLYASDEDPWRFASSDYEREKYADTLKTLPHELYPRALEIGCSIGVLTRALAPRCGGLLAIDAASKPLAEARRRCGDLANVEFAQMFVPRDWPEGEFDLIMLSEVVYYLDVDDVAKLAARIASTLAPDGAVVMVHWSGETDYPLTADQAAERLISELGDLVEVRRRDRRPQYRLDVLIRRRESLQTPQ